MSAGSDAKKEKKQLRSKMKPLREAIPAADREQMAGVIGHRLSEILREVGTVMVFLSFGDELPTDAIAVRLHAEGHALAVPHIDGEVIVPLAYEPGDAVVEATFGIREPAEHRPVGHADIEAVIVPGLAFDRSGHRIGYGGGFYDRLLRAVPEEALRVGVGFHQQLIDFVPRAHLDEALDLVVTDHEVVECHRAG